MSDAVVATPTPTPATPVKKGKATKKAAGTKAKSTKPSHPATAVMVQAAITSLKERGGSSLQAIKKYIASTYKVDAEKLSPFIKKFIKASVTSGGLVQTKGKGASGSFKLPAADKGAAKAKKPAAKKPVAAKKPAAKKAASSTAKPKSKTTKKPPTTPKAPKPKKAKASAAKPAKKPAASKAKKPAKKASPKKK